MYKAFGPWIPSLGLGMIRYIRVLLYLFTHTAPCSRVLIFLAGAELLVSTGNRYIIGSIVLFSTLYRLMISTRHKFENRPLALHAKVDVQAQPRIVKALETAR